VTDAQSYFNIHGMSASAADLFRRLVEAKQAGEPAGLVSVCSAHPLVLEAAMQQALEDGLPLLVESTVNQVNQFGGYTGLQPAGFAAFLDGIRSAAGLPPDRLLLGADHLGPFPWRGEPAEQAMHKARALAADCVRAGYLKLHLDASMPLAGDALGPRGELDPALVARREAELAAAAEAAFRGHSPARSPAPVYVIGTDVPAPGGTAVEGAGVPITPVEELRSTVEYCAQAFRAVGLADAWSRVRAVVVQPGVEFGDRSVQAYDRARAAGLCAAARALPGLVLEGHSTDYQSPAALRALVEDGVAVLKVGPALTFAMREALFALEHIERELAPAEPCRLGEELERAMLADPSHWRGYYRGQEAEQRLARRFSLLDRCRYYWTAPPVQRALERLLANLRRKPIPWTLASQYLPRQAGRAEEGFLSPEPLQMVRAAVREVLRDYAAAVRPAPK
jgi:D-tagatose-1,6-bisphosphate aldolase subunit GatZ/KbaZ